MNKIQKVWLGIFIAMFVVPEVLWSPVSNLCLEFFQNNNNTQPYRNNYLMDSDNMSYLSLVLLLQFIGIFAASVIVFKSKNGWSSKLISLIMFLLAITTIGLFYLSITLGRHGIG